jgi:molecular chaperone GrpE
LIQLDLIKNSFHNFSDPDWESIKCDHGIERTDSFEEFLLSLSKELCSEDTPPEVKDDAGPPEEPPPWESIAEEQRLKLDEKERIILGLEEEVEKAHWEYQNCRDSIKTELEKQKGTANKDLLRSLLSVFDDMQTALENKESKNFADSMELVIKKFFTELGRNGFSKMEIGSDLDVSKCEAIAEVPGGEDGKIAKIVQNGYTLNGVVLRYAKVTVYTGEKEDMGRG